MANELESTKDTTQSEEMVTVNITELSRRVDKIKNAINSRCDSLQSQLSILKNDTESNIEDINTRIDRIRKYLEECVGMITNLDEAIDKVLQEVQQIDKRGEMNSESIRINRKNLQAVLKYAKSLSNSLNEVKSDLDALKETKDDYSKFKWKFTVGVSTAAAVLGWLLAENHIYTVIELIKSKIFGS